MRCNLNIDPKLVAYHEAGHVVAAIHERVPIRYVSILPDCESLGRCSFRRLGAKVRPDVEATAHSRARIEARIIALLGGHAGAEQGMRRSLNDRQALSVADRKAAFELAMLVSGSMRQTDAYMRWLWECSRDLLALPPNRRAVRALANVLLKEHTIGGRRAREIVARAEHGKDGPLEIINLIDDHVSE